MHIVKRTKYLLRNMQTESVLVQEITEKDLPQKWTNLIISEKSNSEKVFIRSNVSNLKECNDWVHSFSEITFTQWINRSSRPNPSSRLLCKKTYACHRSSFNKSFSQKSCTSKNTFCEARIIISVRLTTRHTKDPHSKNGLPAVIRIFPKHNHLIDSLDALKYLTPSKELQEIFNEYFEIGMNALTATRHHEHKLLMEGAKSENILGNPRFNPSLRTARHWYDTWRKATDFQNGYSALQNKEDNIDVDDDDDQDTTFNGKPEINDSDNSNNSYQPSSEYSIDFVEEVYLETDPPSEIPEPSTFNTLQPTIKQSSIDFDEKIDLPSQQGSVIKYIITKMENLHGKYGSSNLAEQATAELFARLSKINTSDEWVNFLHVAAGSSPPDRTDYTKIRTQSTVIQEPNLTTRSPMFRR